MFPALDPILGTAAFAMFAAIAVICAIGLLIARHPLNAAVYLVGVMLSLAGIYALIDSPFMAVLQVLVYAGAIMMLVIFVIMVLNQARDHVVPAMDGFALASLGLPVVIGFLVVRAVKVAVPASPDAVRAGAEVIAPPLFNVTAGGPGYYLLFELIGVILLVAVVAAVLLAKRSLDTPVRAADEEAPHGH